MRWDSKHRENHKKATTEANRRPERRELSRELMKKNGKIRIVGEFRHSEETKKLIGEKGLGREPWNKGLKGSQIPWNKGIKCPNISASKIGHTVSEEVRDRISKTVSMYNNTPEGKMNCRMGALAKAIKYPDPIYYDTKPEKEMKKCLVELGIEFHHQYPVKNIEHFYLADFYLPLFNIVLEVDGVWSHSYPDGLEIDHVRTKELEQAGYRVLRFWEGQFDAQTVWKEI